jgi:hypothetical protein
MTRMKQASVRLATALAVRVLPEEEEENDVD